MPPEPASTPGNALLAACRERLPHYWKLVRGDRPVGTLLLLWPTWWALWLAAEGLPPWHLLLIFSAGVWLTRSAGCVINDYAETYPTDGEKLKDLLNLPSREAARALFVYMSPF